MTHVLLLAASLVAGAFPTSTLSARELSGMGATTDRPWLVERARELAAEHPSDSFAAARLESLVHEAATTAREQAQRSRAVRDYEHAVALHELYLEVWFGSPRVYDLSFERAELLWELGDWQAAALAYHAVVRLDGDGEHALDAAWSELVAWQRAAAAAPAPAAILVVNTVACRPPELCPTSARNTPGVVPGVQRNVLEAADRYVLLTANVDEPRRVRERAVAAYKAFAVLAGHDVADEATSRAQELLRMPGADDLAPPTARTLVEKTAEWFGGERARSVACSLWHDSRLRRDEKTRHVLLERCPTR
jgi:hypothetical protein